MHRVLEDRHELLLGVARQLVEAEVGGKLGDVDGARGRLEGADEKAPRVLPDVGGDVVVAEGREVGGEVRDLLGVGVVVLAGVEGHVDACHPSDVPSPEARAVHHEVGLDVPGVRPDPGDPSVLAVDGGDCHPFEAAGPPVPGAPDKGRHDVDRARYPVGRNPGPADQPLLVDDRVEGCDLVRGDEVHPGDPEPVVHRGEALQLLEAVPVVGDGEAPDRPEPGRLPGLLLDLGEQPARIVEELRQALVGPHGADEAGRVPGRPAREARALEEQNVAPAEPGEVVGGARADDPAADDDGRCPFRYLLLRHLIGLPDLPVPFVGRRLGRDAGGGVVAAPADHAPGDGRTEGAEGAEGAGGTEGVVGMEGAGGTEGEGRPMKSKSQPRSA